MINALLLKRELICEPPYYLDEKYPMVADFDLFMRLLSRENLKGASCEDVLTVLRPGGYSSSNNVQHVTETKKIYKKFFNSFLFSSDELIKMHFAFSGLSTYLKVLLFCKNKKIRASVKKMYTVRYVYCHYKRIVEYFAFLKFLTNPFRFKVQNRKQDNKYSFAQSREWIETFYDDLYTLNLSEKEVVNAGTI